MNSLKEVTGKNSGFIVFHDNELVVTTWAGYQGIPRCSDQDKLQFWPNEDAPLFGTNETFEVQEEEIVECVMCILPEVYTCNHDNFETRGTEFKKDMHGMIYTLKTSTGDVIKVAAPLDWD